MRIESYLENQLFRLIVEASPAGIVMVDAVGKIVLVNPQALRWFGYDESELIGKSVEALIPVSQQDAHVRHRARYHRQPHTRTIADGQDLIAKSKSGAEFPVDISLHSIDSPSGPLTLAYILDATQRQKAKQIPEERLAAIGEMVTGLSHECRNALQRARACLDLLELDLGDDSNQLNLATRIRRALGDLESNYEIVKGYAAPLYLEKTEADLAQLIQEAFDEMHVESGPLQIRLDIIANEGETTNRVDRARMKQVFRNLLENSKAACEEQGRIEARICTVAQNNGVIWQQTAISDSGSGIPTDYRRRIFEPFFTTKQSGTGLGLAICRRIIEAHGGFIAAYDSPRLPGAMLQVDLPMKSN